MKPENDKERLGRRGFLRTLGVGGVAVAALQQANGEVGTIQPLHEAYAACARSGVPLLVDAQASLGRVGAPAAYDALVGDAATVGGPPLGLLVTPARTRFARSGCAHRER